MGQRVNRILRFEYVCRICLPVVVTLSVGWTSYFFISMTTTNTVKAQCRSFKSGPSWVGEVESSLMADETFFPL